jgi:hypothetical protein
MPLTREIATELLEALNEQMERCPACYGMGKVRQSGDYQPCFCLVCEDCARALYLLNKDDPDGMAQLSNPHVLEMVRPAYARVAEAAREFTKRCPGCYGVGKVWAGTEQRHCLVCLRLRKAIDKYDGVTLTDAAAPQVFMSVPQRKLKP